MNVAVSASDCEFRFDFSKVYWNPRLNTEHRRMIEKFKQGEAVCDVMAGVGPFAIPAGKKHIFVHANDLNPDSYASLRDAIERNKVARFVRGYCMDGREFIRQATLALRSTTSRVTIDPNKKGWKGATEGERRQRKKLPVHDFEQPETFDHYVMNLPATAVEFLDAFDGIYAGEEGRFEPHTDRKLPLIHVYCFSEKHDDDPMEQSRQVCEKVSTYIGWKISPHTPEVEIFDVRLVSPTKRMFCASFRLPPQVAYRNVKT